MARNFAKIPTSIWRDTAWRKLSPHAQQLWTLMGSQPELSLCGVVPWRPRFWGGFSTSTTVEAVEGAADELVRIDWLFVDHDTDEAWLPGFFVREKVLKSALTAKGAARAFDAIHSDRIRARVMGELPDALVHRFPVDFLGMPVDALGELLKHPVLQPHQLDLMSSFAAADTPSEGVSEGVSDTPSHTAGAPEIGELRTETSPLPPSIGGEHDPDLRLVVEGEDPSISEAMDVLAERDLQMALLLASQGKGDPVRSLSNFRRYRWRERRAAHLDDAKGLLATYVLTPQQMADVLDGNRGVLRVAPRRDERTTADG